MRTCSWTPPADGDGDPALVGLTDRERNVLKKFSGRDETIKLSDLGDESYLVGGKERQEYSYEDWTTGVRIGTRRNQDGGEQVVIKSVRSNIGRTYGVQGGDVLISVNDVAMSSKTQAINYVRQNPDLPKYVVVIKRLGREITKTIYAPPDE